MLNKKRLILIIGALIIWLSMANAVIMNSFVKTTYRLHKIDLGSIKRNRNVTCHIENFQNIGGIFDIFYIQGWAFCETESDNSHKSINIILYNKSKDIAYISENQGQYRGDVCDVFHKSQKVKGTMHGFFSQFATFDLKAGTYTILINVKENEESYGIIDTGYNLKKTRRGALKIVKMRNVAGNI